MEDFRSLHAPSNDLSNVAIEILIWPMILAKPTTKTLSEINAMNTAMVRNPGIERDRNPTTRVAMLAIPVRIPKAIK